MKKKLLYSLGVLYILTNIYGYFSLVNSVHTVDNYTIQTSEYADDINAVQDTHAERLYELEQRADLNDRSVENLFYMCQGEPGGVNL